MKSSGDPAFELTAHARHVMAERGISIEWVVQALQHPDRTEPHPGDPELRSALARIAEFDGRVLRVVYNDHTIPWRIVTVYFDRSQRNRL